MCVYAHNANRLLVGVYIDCSKIGNGCVVDVFLCK